MLFIFGLTFSIFVVLLKIKVKQKTKQLKIINEQLYKVKELAVESSELKTAFLINVSHEIRAPLNAIYGFAQLLEDKTYSEKKRIEYVDIFKQNTEKLINIVTNIITIALLEKNN